MSIFVNQNDTKGFPCFRISNSPVDRVHVSDSIVQCSSVCFFGVYFYEEKFNLDDRVEQLHAIIVDALSAVMMLVEGLMLVIVIVIMTIVY